MSQDWYFHLNDLTVGYDRKPLISGIDVGIERGEIVTLIGPNGAGKSTILKTITRQLAAIDGSVIFDGGDLSTLSFRELSSRLAVVLTERIRPELMTCHDIVATGRYPYTGRLGILSHEDEDKVDAAMRAVHAEEVGACDFNSISDGQRQRVLLARAICQEPDVIVLDEPTSYLDVRHKIELLEVLRRMAKEQGITVIMALHEIDLACKVSDRIVCVKGDEIYRFCEPEELLEEGLLADLFDIENGSFDPLFGSAELPAVSGQPRALVLSSGGTGIPIYRKLQRLGIPFAAGVLYGNDIDYRLARKLASEVVVETPFKPISNAAIEHALELVETCELVVDAGFTVGETNARMAEIREAARAAGKLVGPEDLDNLLRRGSTR